jgi:hypothetical protein
MTKITDLKVYDLKESIIACRNSMRIEPAKHTKEEFEQSLERAKKLTKLGNGHDNFLCGIRVSFNLVYPNYLSPELQRYHWLDIVNSSSKMHKLFKIVEGGGFNKYVSEGTISYIEILADTYNKDKTYDNFMKLISNCPLGLELFMRVSTNYLQLKTIYNQRRNHKLKEDWGVICSMIEELPYSELIIGDINLSDKKS